ncbi:MULTISPECIES: hypothetical protein [unclassified Aureispira]|uniref:hypothetical protein n=1 Tax=unclassified Aureispira TaxID=2649989 RepID=UPI0007C82A9C|nr:MULTISPECIES: hypothetical protein [unclassified Aureispira]WMX15816.1 hypothetical protein QP953_05385 [Aureispira sp. CCB-E]
MNALLLSMSWGEFLIDVVQHPQKYVFWLIVFLIVLFLLSRLRNIMEERGVNRAIYISRGFVGTFIAFIVTPVVFFIILNLVAIVHGVNTIDISFLAKWIGLTLTSYWWLLKCFFGSESLSGATEIYSLDAIIRIFWVLLPFSIIWFRVSSSRIGKLFLIPLIIGVFVITRYKTAPPTFITEDRELVNKIPGLNWFTDQANGNSAANAEKQFLDASKRKIIAGALALVIIIGFVVGLYLEYRVIGLLVTLIGLLGFLLMAPHEKEKVIPPSHHRDYHMNIDSLIYQMDSLYAIDQKSIEVYNISMKISSAYQARIDVGDMIRFPDTLCVKYESYFYDWCKE